MKRFLKLSPWLILNVKPPLFRSATASCIIHPPEVPQGMLQTNVPHPSPGICLSPPRAAFCWRRAKSQILKRSLDDWNRNENQCQRLYRLDSISVRCIATKWFYPNWIDTEFHVHYWGYRLGTVLPDNCSASEGNLCSRCTLACIFEW